MRHYPVSALLTAVAVSLGLGAGLAFAIRSDSAPETGSEAAPASSAVSTSSTGCVPYDPKALAATKAIGVLLTNTSAAKQINPDDPSSIDKLLNAAMSDATVRRDLMERYRSAPDGEAKEHLKRLLSSLQAPDVLAFTMELARASDAAQRRDGFEMLAGLGLKLPDVRQLARQTLVTEQDPAVLTQAIAALQPAATGPAERAATIAQLRYLTQHRDPDVRAQAMRTFAGWDNSGVSAGPLQRALADSSEQVRWGAISALAENHIRSEELKRSLLSVFNDPQELPDIRLSAAAALEQYALSQQEYTHLTNTALELDRQLHGADLFDQARWIR